MRLGYRIDLGAPVLPRLPKKTRNTVRRSSRVLFVRQGTLEELTRIHWDKAYLPISLGGRQHVYVAELNGTIISAVLLEEDGDHLTYRYSGNDRGYMNYNGNTYLLWWAAEHYNEKGYRYIDLGGSTKKNIEDYKRRLSTSSYPLKPKSLRVRLTNKIWYHLRRLLA